MPIYQYKGVDGAGKKASGIIDADSPKLARQKLKKLEIFPFDLAEKSVRDKEGGFAQLLERLKQSAAVSTVSKKDLAVMTRQLATLVGAGIPLVGALSALVEQVDDDHFKAVLAKLKEMVNEGASLGDAMAEHKDIFSNMYIAMVRAGEIGGALEVVLKRLSDFLEAQVILRGKIASAMTYPLVMGMVGVAVMSFMIGYVIPKITVVFEHTDRALPYITQFVLGITGFITSIWGLMMFVAIGAGILFLRGYLKTPAGKENYDKFLFRVPVFGDLSRMIAVSRFSRTLSTLLTSGIPLVKSLDIVKDVVDNTLLGRSIEQARESINEGAPIARPLAASGYFPPVLIHMIDVGEKTGELESMLEHVSDSIDAEVDAKINAMTSILEPLIIVMMGAIIAFVVVAVLLPIIQMTEGI